MSDTSSFYRRPLPAGHVAFATPAGRVLFKEALDAGTLESFFPLIEQFHTQADPAFCGLASLVVALNALGIDPGRLWRGSWRWFSEELLDCCAPLERVRKAGVSLAELACLARCNGAKTTLDRADERSIDDFRQAVELAASAAADPVLIVGYSRAGLGQTGGGHFSPVGGYHRRRDLVLILDVARFKYPPHWVPLAELYESMRGIDPSSGRSRGWVTLRPAAHASRIAILLSCPDGIGVRGALEALIEETRARLRASPPRDIFGALRIAAECVAMTHLEKSIKVRDPKSAEHAQVLAQLTAELTQSRAHRILSELTTPDNALATSAWLLVASSELWSELPESLARELDAIFEHSSLAPELAREVLHARSQLEFLLRYAGALREPAANASCA
jgi:glutathione gamma-glutamylcysteinyltransferase